MKRCARSLFAAVILMVSGSGMALADGVVQFGDIRLGVQEGDVGYVNVVRSGSTVGAVSPRRMTPMSKAPNTPRCR